MTNTKPVRRRQPGRIFPEFTIPQEEFFQNLQYHRKN
ncbi:hypothetical protein NIES3585_35280 [Nodularia sp. NIES-3585]|nr:hypothetical protein NIES3585_35280 [Nodularia sp. NIES-3585]